MSLERALEKRWAEYERLKSDGAFFGGLVRAGEILKCIDAREISGAEREAWLGKITTQAPSGEIVEGLEGEARSRLGRAEHILECGNHFEVEELVLVLTLRLDVESALAAATALQVHWARVSFEKVDELLTATAASRENALRFATAQRLIRSNCGLPLRMKWLSRSARDSSSFRRPTVETHVTEAVKLLRKTVGSPETLPDSVALLQEMVWNDNLIGRSAVQEILRDLAYDLDFYEPDPQARGEDASLFGDTRALAEIEEALVKLERTEQ